MLSLFFLLRQTSLPSACPKRRAGHRSHTSSLRHHELGRPGGRNGGRDGKTWRQTFPVGWFWKRAGFGRTWEKWWWNLWRFLFLFSGCKNWRFFFILHVLLRVQWSSTTIYCDLLIDSWYLELDVMDVLVYNLPVLRWLSHLFIAVSLWRTAADILRIYRVILRRSAFLTKRTPIGPLVIHFFPSNRLKNLHRGEGTAGKQRNFGSEPEQSRDEMILVLVVDNQSLWQNHPGIDYTHKAGVE